MKKPFTVKEFAVLVGVLKVEGAHESIVGLISLVGGQVPRDPSTEMQAVSAVARLVDPNRTAPATKREIDSVKPHSNAIDDPTYRGSVVAKPSALDAPRVKNQRSDDQEEEKPKRKRRK